MKKINVAIIGYGLSGRIFHGAILNSMAQYNIKAVVTTDPAKIKLAKEALENIHIYDTPEDVFNDKSIDLVVISTPNTSHFELARNALNNHKHVIIEKPFTISTDDALKLISLQEKNNKILSVYHNRRFDGDFLTLKKVINDGSLGRLVEFESHFDRFRNTIKENAWREKALPGSGMLYDLGSHLIDQTLELFGLPNEVYADLASQRRGPTDDSFEIILYYSEFKVTLKSSIHVKEALPRFILHGTNGSFVKYGMDVQEDQLLDGLRPEDDNYGVDITEHHGVLNTKSRQTIKTIKGDYSLYYRNIFNAITNDEKLNVTAKDGFNVIKIIEAAMNSNKSACRITIKK